MNCKLCGKEIEEDIHDGICEECHQEVLRRIEDKEKLRNKEIEESQANKAKRPIYKKWWFWVIILIIIIMIAGGSSDTNNTVNNTNTSNNVASKTSTTSSSTNTKKAEKIPVTIIDFSQMSKEEIQNWCTTNKISCNITEEYSDTIAKDGFISQSIEANTTAYEGDKITITYSLGKAPTMGEKNALSSAKNYLEVMAFSYKSLIKQLEFEGYSTEEATYGADNCGADWNEQAAKSAKSYIETMSFSRKSLIEQLKYEGFTPEQAEYGATAVGY